MKMVIVALYYIRATDYKSKYSNCTVNPSEYLKENQAIHFHHYCQVCLIYYFNQDQTPILMHMILYRILVRPGYFINLLDPETRRNVTRMT